MFYIPKFDMNVIHATTNIIFILVGAATSKTMQNPIAWKSPIS